MVRLEKSVNVDFMNLFFAGDVKAVVSEMSVASCDDGVEFATSEKGKYGNTKMTQSILL